MKRLGLLFALLLLLHGVALAVLPQQFKSNRLQDSTTASQIDDGHNEAEQAIAEILGYPVDTDIATAAFRADATGVRGVKFQAYTEASLPASCDINEMVLVTDLESAPCMARCVDGTSFACLSDPSSGFSPGDFGIVGDLHKSYDGSIDVGVDAGLLTIASATCVTSDAGKLVAIKGAGAAGAIHSTTIASCQSGKFRLTVDASTTVSSVLVYYGTDNEAGYDAMENAIEALSCNAKVDWGGLDYWGKSDASDTTDWFRINCQLTGTGLLGGPGQGNLYFVGSGATIVRHPSVSSVFSPAYMESFHSSGITYDGNNEIISTETPRAQIITTANVGTVEFSPDTIFQHAAGSGLTTYYDIDRGFTPRVDISGVTFDDMWELCYQLKGFDWEGGVVHGIGANCFAPQPHPNFTSNMTATLGFVAETDADPGTSPYGQPFGLEEWDFSNAYVQVEAAGGGASVGNAKCFGLNMASHEAVIRNAHFNNSTCYSETKIGAAVDIINGTKDDAGDYSNIDISGLIMQGPGTSQTGTYFIRISSGDTGWTNRKNSIAIDRIQLRGFVGSNSKAYVGVLGDWSRVNLHDWIGFPRTSSYTDLVRFDGNVELINQSGMPDGPSNRGQILALADGKTYGWLTGQTWVLKRTWPSVGEAVEIGTFLQQAGFGAASGSYLIATTIDHLTKSWILSTSSQDQPGGYTYAAPISSASTGSNESFDYDLHVDPGQTGSVTKLRLFNVKGTPPTDTTFRISITPLVSRGGSSLQHAPLQFTPSTTASAVSWPTEVYWGSFENYTVFRRRFTYEELVTAGTDHDTTILTFDRQYKITDAYLDVTTPYVCASTCTTSTLDQDLGTSAGGQEIIVDSDIDAAAAVFGDADAELGTSFNRAGAVQGGYMPSWGSGGTITMRTTSGTGNLGDGAATFLNAGETNVYVGVKKLR